LEDTDVPQLSSTEQITVSAWSPDSSEILVMADNTTSRNRLYAVSPTLGTAHLLYKANPGDSGVEPGGWYGLPSDDATLAVMYRPYMKFGSTTGHTEHFFPTTPDSIMGDDSTTLVEWYVDHFAQTETALPMTLSTDTSDPYHSLAWWEWEYAHATAPPDPLGGALDSGVKGFDLDGAAEGPNHGKELTDYAAASADCDPDCNGQGDIYDKVTRTGDVVYIQYWMFYRFNDVTDVGHSDLGCTFYQPACDQHQGDWEGVELALSNQGRVDWVAFSQHRQWSRYENNAGTNGLEALSWDGAGFRDHTHLLDYVAIGSHANYPLPCDHAENCYSPEPGRLFTGDGEADHNGATAWFGNTDDECYETCVEDLDSQDFMADTGVGPLWLEAYWGVVPPLSAGNSTLNGAPGGPDATDGSHSTIYDDPGGSPLLKDGSLLDELYSDNDS
jgi:hypothetical protein